MKLVQTFWSKPYEHFSNSTQYGGFPSKEIFFKIWSLSMLELNKFGEEVLLVTDDLGREYLKEILELPYTSVLTDLNEIHNIPPDLWAISKVYTYGIMKEPFCHVDGDFIFRNGMPMIQNNVDFCFEFINLFTDEGSRKLVSHLKNNYLLPSYLSNYIVYCNFNYKDVNCGFVRVDDINFIQKYVEDVFTFVNSNINLIINDDFLNGKINNVFEQLILAAKLKSENRSIALLKSNGNYEAVLEPDLFFPSHHHIMHFYGKNYKASRYFNSYIQYFENHYPSVSERIEKAFN